MIEITTPLIVPRDILWHAGVPLVGLVEIDPSHLTRPFWSDIAHPGLRPVAVRPLDRVDFGDGPLGLDGGIFHMSRCGSTLMARQFAALPNTVALSEPAVFQAVLDSPHGTRAERARWLRALMFLFGEGFRPAAPRFVVKWPILLSRYADEVCAAFPETPGIFLYRHPVEVLVSILERPLGNMTVQNPFHWGMTSVRELEHLTELERTAYFLRALVLGAAAAPQLRSLDYADLPEATWDWVARFFGFTLSTSDIEQMRVASRFSAKSAKSSQIFSPDAERKRSSASAKTRELAATIVEPALRHALAQAQRA